MRTSWVQDRVAKPERRGFSLVELLVVIAIIALIISIVLPVLGGARKAGRKLASQGVLNDIASASSQFKLDHQGRNPGYFSPRAMGSDENATRGMSEMENVMLDLAGQNAIKETAGPNTVEVGPVEPDPNGGTQTILVDPSLIGTDKGAYFTPSREYYTAQLASTGQQIASIPGHAGSSETDIQLLDVVDAFGQPVLYWSADDYTVKEVTQASEFVARDSSGQPAMFYWNSNAAFLQATNLGKLGEDMTIAPDPDVKSSLIGSGAINDPVTMRSMQALLGSPSAPRSDISGQTVEDLLASPSEASIDGLYPGRAKGSFIIQSAGIDGVYMSARDRGFSTVAIETNNIEYGLDFFVSPTARVTTDDDNKPTSRDVISEFDEIIVSGGG